MKQKGLTLIELMIVLAILGIIASVAMNAMGLQFCDVRC